MTSSLRKFPTGEPINVMHIQSLGNVHKSYCGIFFSSTSNSIWAFSTVGFGYDESCGTNVHNEYVHVSSDDPLGDKELVYETLEVIAENALPRLDKFKAQGEHTSFCSPLLLRAHC